MHKLFDLINGVFELGGSVLLWLNVAKLRKDKAVRGVHWYPVIFFFAWGLWNLAYYPSLGQELSTVGGVDMVLANGAWLWLLLKYKKARRSTKNDSIY